MSIIIDWWKTSGKYNKYRGKDNKGLRGNTIICAHLAISMNVVSRTVRTANSVKCKISYIEGTRKKAHDWAGATGQGAKENEGIESFTDGIFRYCKYYFILCDVMEDRCSSRPSVSTKDFYHSDDTHKSNNFSSDDPSTTSSESAEVIQAKKKTQKCKTPPLTITPTKKMKESEYFNILDRESLGLQDGGTYLEYKKLEEHMHHNMVLEERLIIQNKKEEHEYNMLLLKDFIGLKKT